MAKQKEFIGCVLKQLPEELHMPAMDTAIDMNPANAVNPAAAVKLTPARLAVLTSRYWGSGGVKLGVYFMDTPSQGLRQKILFYANKWTAYANISFAEAGKANAQIRLARKAGDGYWSYLGTDILHIPSSEPTMNLDTFTVGTDDAEYERVVPHEFGHSCGFPHEHQRREVIALLDQKKTVAVFGRLYGWSPSEVQQQVFVPLEESSIRATPQADVTSIMAYEFSGDCTKSGEPIPGGTRIDALDGAFAAKLYPLPGGPTNPPAGGVVVPASGSYSLATTADGKKVLTFA